MQAADNFDFTFLDDAHPEPRRGFVIKVIPGFVGMRRAARNDRRQVGSGDAHGLSEGANAFRSKSNIHKEVGGSVRCSIPIRLPISRPTATASVVLTRPGTRKEWLITYLPIRVVPERSKLIAAMMVP